MNWSRFDGRLISKIGVGIFDGGEWEEVVRGAGAGSETISNIGFHLVGFGECYFSSLTLMFGHCKQTGSITARPASSLPPNQFSTLIKHNT